MYGILSEMTRSDLDGRPVEVAVWPVGATEPHGLHLPFGIDAITVETLARRAVGAANARGARALMLPTMPYGIDTNLMAFPYTVTLTPTTLIRVAGDLIASLVRHGVPKLLLANGHGGNTDTMKAICREYADRDIFIATINAWALAPDVVARVIETPAEHACEFETSIALALRPDLVQMDRAAESPTRRSRLERLQEYGGAFTRPWERFTVNSGTGHPEKATREKGEAIVAALIERLSEVVLELSATPRDALFPYRPLEAEG